MAPRFLVGVDYSALALVCGDSDKRFPMVGFAALVISDMG